MTHSAFAYADEGDQAIDRAVMAGERWTATFEDWRDALSAEARVDAMQDWMDATRRMRGVMVGEPSPRTPWLGHWATVEVDLVDQFDNWLRDNRWPARGRA